MRSRLAVVMVFVLLSWGCTSRSPQPESDRPSIVLILTDDQRWDTLWAMRAVREQIAARGFTFENGFVVNALCCPSRASVLTGRYSHSTGVYTNAGPHGGFGIFNDESTVGTWLHDAGYTTALMGKYLNGYIRTDYVPPGWDKWVGLETRAEGGGYYYDYDMNLDGTVIHRGDRKTDYSTDVLAHQAVSFIRHAEGPMFLYFAPWAPHGPPAPVPRHENVFAHLRPFRPPSFNEADVSDKPVYLSSHHPRFTPEAIREIDNYRRGQLQSLLAADEAIARIIEALRETGRLHDTMIVFTSDNGFFWGEHRLNRKQAPYEEAIRVPFVVRYDPLTSEARNESRFVLNIDLAPTFADLAATGAPGADGRSFLPLLRGDANGWRTDFLIEHMFTDKVNPPDYCAVRNERYLYALYGTGEEELYDLTTDPHELTNRAGDRALDSVRRSMRRRVAELCRPPPPGFPPDLP